MNTAHTLLLLSVLTFSLTGCLIPGPEPDDTEDTRTIAYSLEPTFVPTDKIMHERSGGGAILYTVTPTGTGYSIRIISREGTSPSETLTVPTDSLEPDHADIIAGIFNGSTDIGGIIYEPPPDILTGTWHTMKIKTSDSWLRIANSEAINALLALEQIVDKQTSAPLLSH